METESTSTAGLTTRRIVTGGGLAALFSALILSRSAEAQVKATKYSISGCRKNIHVLETISDLIGIPIGNTLVALVLGYHTIGDGGGGVFYWDEGNMQASNGGTVIDSTQSASGRWIRIQL
jgi:hypothetical protein